MMLGYEQQNAKESILLAVETATLTTLISTKTIDLSQATSKEKKEEENANIIMVTPSVKIFFNSPRREEISGVRVRVH